MKDSQIAALLTPVLAARGLELEAVEVVPAGKRRLVRVVVDGDGPDGRGPLLDDIASASSALSLALDESDLTGNSPYTLEVSSRGVSRPLTRPAHWRRNRSRLVAVTTTTGEDFVGRIVGADEDGASLDVDGSARELHYDEIAKALIQVELNRRATDVSDEERPDEGGLDEDDPNEGELDEGELDVVESDEDDADADASDHEDEER